MILSGWKEIANYLGCGIRTAQRWEKSGLPVHRPVPGRRSHVVTDSEQLACWVRDSAFRNKNRTDMLATVQRSRKLHIELQQAVRTLDVLTREMAARQEILKRETLIESLYTELRLANTFCRIALEAKSRQKREHSRRNARKAYDALLRFAPKANLKPDETRRIQSRMAKLKLQLQALGEDLA